MEIFQYTPGFLVPLTQFYNRLTADVPHCYPVKQAELAAEMNGTTGQIKIPMMSLIPKLRLSQCKMVWCWRLFTLVIIGMEKTMKCTKVLFGFLGYERGARHAGQTLLEKAEAYLNTFNVPKIIAFCSHARCYRYDFYHFMHAKLSITLDHVHALLGHNGYRPRYCQVFLDWENYAVTPIPSRLPVTLSVDWKQGRGQRPNCTVRAHQEGERFGICLSVCGGEFSSHADAQDWVYTE